VELACQSVQGLYGKSFIIWVFANDSQALYISIVIAIYQSFQEQVNLLEQRPNFMDGAFLKSKL